MSKLSPLLVVIAAALGGTFVHAAEAPVAQVRPTFNESVDDIVLRYNSLMKQVDANLLLPPEKRLTPAARNETFHVLERKLTPSVAVNFEVDNATGRPFSMNMVGYMDEPGKVGPLLAVMSGVAATTLGKGEENAGSILRACTAAAKSKTNNSQTRVRGFTAYCSVIQGVWIAGINVNPK